MTSSREIEGFLQEMRLRFFSDNSSGACWTVHFQGGFLTIFLQEDGEYLLVRTSAFTQIPEKHGRCELLEAVLRRNDRIKVGRYVLSDDNVHFEAAIWLDGEAQLVLGQFNRLISTAAGALSTGRAAFEDDKSSSGPPSELRERFSQTFRRLQ